MTEPAYDGRVEVLDEVFFFRRSARMLRRLEQRFGALPTLARRLAAFDVAQSDIARIYAELIWGEPSAPTVEAIEAWVFATGSFKHGRALEQVLLEMVVGNDELRRHEAQRLAEAEERGDPANPPTAAAATAR